MMASRTRGRKRPERPKRPYLSEWILTQPSPRKEVLLQVFSGTSELECSRRLHMPLEEVEEIARKAAKEAPLFREDEYEMAYYSAHDAEEFYRITGEGEGTYKFLSLRYPKAERKPAVPATAQGIASPTSQTAMPSHASTPTQRHKSTAQTGKSSTKPHKASPKIQARQTESSTVDADQTPARSPANDAEAQARREARRAARELAAREREWERHW